MGYLEVKRQPKVSRGKGRCPVCLNTTGSRGAALRWYSHHGLVQHIHRDHPTFTVEELTARFPEYMEELRSKCAAWQNITKARAAMKSSKGGGSPPDEGPALSDEMKWQGGGVLAYPTLGDLHASSEGRRRLAEEILASESRDGERIRARLLRRALHGRRERDEDARLAPAATGPRGGEALDDDAGRADPQGA